MLYIAAPDNYFDKTKLKNLSKTKYGFFQKKVVINDPIVFRFVYKGIQVLSKWGLEANDENLVNEKLN